MVVISCTDGSLAWGQTTTPLWRIATPRAGAIHPVSGAMAHNGSFYDIERGIAAIASDMDVFGFVGHIERIGGQVGFHEPPVWLSVQGGERLGRQGPQLDPGREGGDVEVFGPVENELGDDLLHPGGAGFHVGGDDDVVVAEGEVVPDGGGHEVVVEGAGHGGLSRRLDTWILTEEVLVTTCSLNQRLVPR